MSNLSQLLVKLGYNNSATIISQSDLRTMWLVETGCSFTVKYGGWYGKKDIKDMDKSQLEEVGIEVVQIEGGQVHQPIMRDVPDILQLLQELSGKHWCLILMADCNDDFFQIDEEGTKCQMGSYTT